MRIGIAVMGSIVIAVTVLAFVAALIFRDPNWAMAIVYTGTLIVTFCYASSNQRLVESYEKDRKRHVVKGMAKTIFSPMRDQLKTWEVQIEDGYFLAQLIHWEKKGIEDQITLFPSPNDYLRQLSHTPDQVLKGYLEEIKKSISDYDEAASRFKQFLKEISKKRRDMGDDFDNFCKTLKSDYSPPDIEAMFAFTIAGGEIIRYNPYAGFYKDTISHLRAYLIGKSFEVDMGNYPREKKGIVLEIKNLDTILDRLLSDWREEYDLTPEDYSSSR